jgi:hypothetical protein
LTETIVIACRVVVEELRHLLGPQTGCIALDSGLHLSPSRLRTAVREAIDSIDGPGTILLGYGLCSMGLTGISSRTRRLVIPRVDDCIAIFLGSAGAYRKQHERAPGTYYLTKGWIEGGFTPYAEYEKTVVRYGRTRSVQLLRDYFKNYSRVALIRTGNYPVEPCMDHVERTAELLDLRSEVIQGSNEMLEKLVNGPWDGEFLVVEPGQNLEYHMFLPASAVARG